jgi:hypothetical protein
MCAVADWKNDTGKVCRSEPAQLSHARTGTMLFIYRICRRTDNNQKNNRMARIDPEMSQLSFRRSLNIFLSGPYLFILPGKCRYTVIAGMYTDNITFMFGNTLQMLRAGYTLTR